MGPTVGGRLLAPRGAKQEKATPKDTVLATCASTWRAHAVVSRGSSLHQSSRKQTAEPAVAI